MTISNKTRRLKLTKRMQRKKRRRVTKKMHGRGLGDQSLSDFHYDQDRIPKYLPNLPETHESYEVLKSILDRHPGDIKSYCKEENDTRWWKSKKLNKFPDILKRLKVTAFRNYKFFSTERYYDEQRSMISYPFKLFPQKIILGITTEYTGINFFLNTDENIQHVLHEHTFEPTLIEDVWCRATFSPAWTCKSTKIETIKMKERIDERKAELKDTHIELEIGKFPPGNTPYESNKITYYLNNEAQFEVNCIRYAPGYINIEVVDLVTKSPLKQEPSETF